MSGAALAGAVRSEAARHARAAGSVMQLAEVTRADPLTLELQESRHTLHEDELTLSQWVKTLQANDGLAEGDVVLVMRKQSGGGLHWIVTDGLVDAPGSRNAKQADIDAAVASEAAVRAAADTTLGSRATALEAWRVGSKGFMRAYDQNGTGNAPGKGFTWNADATTGVDSSYYAIATPPGGPPYASSSGVRVLVSGWYRIDASVLCQGSSPNNRYDTDLVLLNSAGAGLLNMDMAMSDGNLFSFAKFRLGADYPLTAGQYAWVNNVGLTTYGDSGAAWSWIQMRYLGT